MNYHRYIRTRMLEISYLRARMQKLFAVLSDRDYGLLQELLTQAENVLKRYLAQREQDRDINWVVV